MTTEHDVVRGLAWLAAERCLVALETAAWNHGEGTHLFKESDGKRDRVSVRRSVVGLTYHRSLPPAPEERISRDEAIKDIATDKALLVEGIRG